MKNVEIILKNLFINYKKKPAICWLFLCLILSSCGTTPPHFLKKIIDDKYPGYFVSYKTRFGHDQPLEADGFVSIDCEGKIKYDIDEPYSLIFKKDSDDGVIVDLQDGQITYKSWLFGIQFNKLIGKPQKEINGCLNLSFDGKSFKTYYPIDCSQPKKTFYERLDEMLEFVKNKNYVSCE